MLYTGIAKNPSDRFLLHLGGKGAKYTRINKPIKIVHLEKYDSRSDALKREAIIKKMSKKQKENLFLS
jgi:putative endonuclease